MRRGRKDRHLVGMVLFAVTVFVGVSARGELELSVVELRKPAWIKTNEFWLRPLSGDDPSDPFSVCARPHTKGSPKRPRLESSKVKCGLKGELNERGAPCRLP